MARAIAVLITWALVAGPATADSHLDFGESDTEIKIGNIVPYTGSEVQSASQPEESELRRRIRARRSAGRSAKKMWRRLDPSERDGAGGEPRYGAPDVASRHPSPNKSNRLPADQTVVSPAIRRQTVGTP
jgi:hypothetical protein